MAPTTRTMVHCPFVYEAGNSEAGEPTNVSRGRTRPCNCSPPDPAARGRQYEVDRRRRDCDDSSTKAGGIVEQGGIITLIDERGVKVHGVSYTRNQARKPE